MTPLKGAAAGSQLGYLTVASTGQTVNCKSLQNKDCSTAGPIAPWKNQMYVACDPSYQMDVLGKHGSCLRTMYGGNIGWKELPSRLNACLNCLSRKYSFQRIVLKGIAVQIDICSLD